MKNKKLLLGSSVITLIIAAFIFAPVYFDSTPKDDSEEVVVKTPQKAIKGAMQYNWERRKNVNTGKVELTDLLESQRAVEEFAAKQSKSSAAGLNLSWAEMGPDNVGGRTRAILFDKFNPKRMYAGGVSGGIWRSEDGGVTWVKATTQLAPEDNLAVSCITQAADGAIYVGTGESFAGSGGFGGGYGNTAFIGKGVWKSTDGVNFSRLSSTVPATENSSSVDWAYVNRLAADPVNANRIYAGIESKLKISYDGGVSWANAKYCANPPTCSVNINLPATTDVKVGSDGSVFASASGQVYYSATGDTNSFSPITTNFPDNLSGAARIELAIAPSNPNYIYCCVSKASDGTLLNIYQSKDKGQSWNIVIPGSGSIEIFNGQGWYDNAIAVYPDNPEHIIVGGVSLFDWSKTGGWAESDIFQVHSDKHTFAFHPAYDGVNNKTLFVGTDGGIYTSNYAGAPFSYEEMNRNYITTQFYAVGFSRDGAVAGGTQDNGNPYIDGTGNTTKSQVYNLPSGDGGYVQISTINPNAFFWESQNGEENRSSNKALGGGSSFFPDAGGGQWVTPFLLWESFNDLNSKDSIQFTANVIDPATGDTIENTYQAGDTIVLYSNNRGSNNKGYPFNYITPAAINPGDTLMIQDIVQSKFFAGLNSGIWMAKDVLDFSKGPEWYKLSAAAGAVCMGYSNDGDVLFVGVSNSIRRISGILSIKDGDPLLAPPGITSTTISIPTGGGKIVTGIAVDPNDANNVLVTLGQYGGVNHVHRSTNALGAATFTSIQNNLPPMPVYDAVIDKTDPNRILVGTEYGIYGTENGFDPVVANVLWTEENTGMARVPTYMIGQQWHNNNTCTGVTNSGVIYIGTHGRGIFKCSTFADPQATPANLCMVGTGMDDRAYSFNPNMKIYPNPINNGKGNVSFNLDRSTTVTIRIFDFSGRVIETIDMGKQTAGAHKVTFDTGGLSAGTYFVSLTAGEFRQAAKFVVIN